MRNYLKQISVLRGGIKKSSKRFEVDSVVVEMTGQTGNQMFGFMAGYSQASRLNCDLELDFTNVPNLLGEFKINNQIKFFDSKKTRLSAIYKESDSHEFNSKINNIGVGTKLMGYFQNWKYFENVDVSCTRSFFSLSNPSKVFQSLERTFSQNKILVIHVRNYEKPHRNFHGVIPKEYFENSIKLARKIDGFEKIFVFSDNIKEAKERLGGIHIKIDEYIDSNIIQSPAETIILMSKSHSFIGSNSSFSWWAAYLSESISKTIIFPRPWYKDNEWIYASQYLPGWLTIGFSEWNNSEGW